MPIGALFFYIVVYLLGYYVCHVLNLLKVRPWIRNRYIAALIPVFLVGTVHAYYIISSPPPRSQDTSMGFALGYYIVMPIVVVTLGAFYAMWQDKTQHNNSDS
tara:strand:+ start:1372 stop:1680 length:309 start_codon:yes stop_codon:yes gene_type:complete